MFLPAGSKSSHQSRHHLCMADPAIEGLLSHYQSLVVQSTRTTYQAGVRALQEFCTHYATAAFPTSPLTYATSAATYVASQVLYKTIKVYLAGIWPEYLERGLEDPTKDEQLHLLCTGIKRSQGTQTHIHLPITINVLQTLCCDPSFPPLEERFLWAAFTQAFYGFFKS